MQSLVNAFLTIVLCLFMTVTNGYAAPGTTNRTIDRVELVSEQIALLQSRLNQGEKELAALQQQHDKDLSHFTLNGGSKNLIDKAGLDISVSKSNLESIDIELADCLQTISWLGKSIQEYNNQINVLTMFGPKIAKDQTGNAVELNADLLYQQRLLTLEKKRSVLLTDLQRVASNIVLLEKDNLNQLTKILKSNTLLQVKQQQVKDELAYQQQQNKWLEELNVLYAEMATIDPMLDKDKYTTIERKIFYANESANFAYSQSLIARYKDQIQQMRLAVLKSNSISLLNEISDQIQAITLQVTRLDDVLKSRSTLLQKHISYMSRKRPAGAELQAYVAQLKGLNSRYETSEATIVQVNHVLNEFRTTLDQELQRELSLRQGLPTFSERTLLDFGKEMLLMPELTFQIVKNLSNQLMAAFQSTSIFEWCIFGILECLLALVFSTMHKFVNLWLSLPSVIKSTLNAKWIGLRWLDQNAADLFIMANLIGTMYFFNIPYQTFSLLVYFSIVWLVFKNVYVGARLCLVETTHDTSGHDVRLFRRLKWMIIVGGVITALTVYVHQLPLIYELKNLCDRVFLIQLMVISILLLRSWRVMPDLILTQMDTRHPYFEKSVLFIGILIPVLMLGNALIGVFGYVNLIMTISWHEGIFLIVLVAYLMLRGLMSDALEQISRLMIQHVNNGWLLTEAFLKPVDRVLRIGLFLLSGMTLFLLYGWDEKSPIVVRLMGLLHYELAHVLNTTITPLNMIELVVVISVFYWTAKWIREFVFRILSTRTKDMGMRNSIAVLSQYSVVILGLFLCLRVLGIDLRALAVVAGMLAFGIGFGLRDLASNFVCGFLILLERPLRVGDIVSINNIEGEVTDIGSRAVTVKTWDHMELLVPNSEIFYKTFINWTAKDNIVRSVASIKICRHDNPHEVKGIIQQVVSAHPEVLKDPAAEVYLKDISDTLLEFEIRYYVNIRQALSRTRVMSSVLMNVWDAFALNGIKPPYPQHEIFIRDDLLKSFVHTQHDIILAKELPAMSAAYTEK